jgi:hypothetical protein
MVCVSWLPWGATKRGLQCAFFRRKEQALDLSEESSVMFRKTYLNRCNIL